MEAGGYSRDLDQHAAGPYPCPCPCPWLDLLRHSVRPSRDQEGEGREAVHQASLDLGRGKAVDVAAASAVEIRDPWNVVEMAYRWGHLEVRIAGHVDSEDH